MLNPNKLLILLILLLSCIIIAMPVKAGTKFIPISGYGTLVKVVDGDTLKLEVNGKVANYRLAAVDTPETYNNIKAKKDIKICKVSKYKMFKLGKTSKEFVKARYYIGDIIEYTQIDVGRYHRPIIWVDGLLPNLIKFGMARVVIFNNVPIKDITLLKTLEQKAISSNIGIWKVMKCWRPK